MHRHFDDDLSLAGNSTQASAAFSGNFSRGFPSLSEPPEAMSVNYSTHFIPATRLLIGVDSHASNS
jgi:hypothetical protein